MKRKNNTLLFSVVLFLFLIIICEIYYVFFSQKQEDFVEITKISADINANVPKNIEDRISEKQAKPIFDNISAQQNDIKRLYEARTLTSYIATETYKSLIIEFGKKDVTKQEGGKSVHIVYVVSFRNDIRSTSLGKTTFYLSDKEVGRITTTQLVGDKEIPISREEIKVGDLVSILIQSDYFADPADSLIRMKITKL